MRRDATVRLQGGGVRRIRSEMPPSYKYAVFASGEGEGYYLHRLVATVSFTDHYPGAEPISVGCSLCMTSGDYGITGVILCGGAVEFCDLSDDFICYTDNGMLADTGETIGHTVQEWWDSERKANEKNHK